ncbi:uncharacterized protein Pyn_28287 [Prunus yedoensis var. nudiflora]|uniref:S-protein homolog n=1 Tax=Prunus yedoensis var. nudiflora TaxID=2094558 RepID=A0A314UM04_PRUYE|nr:uncharacterized protein Pyn_28287 [Prunus yedoensis var. nudiflora]
MNEKSQKLGAKRKKKSHDNEPNHQNPPTCSCFCNSNKPHLVSPSSKSEVFPEFTKWHVYVVNGLNDNQTLLVHCNSKEDDLGIQNLSQGANTTWSFRTNFVHSTLFGCYMSKANAHAALKVFWQDIYLFQKCNWKNCIYIAKDDGVYIKDFPNDCDVFAKKWEDGRR